MSDPGRFDRQKDLLPPENLNIEIAVIGVGAVGRQVAMQLAAAGATTLRLIDFDTVELVNLGPQGWLPSQIGKPKVEACEDACIAIFGSGSHVKTENDRFRPFMINGAQAVFCCVDNMDIRSSIFEAVTERKTGFFVDGRMSGEALRVLATEGVDDEGMNYYRRTLFPQSEAQEGACTAKATIYSANICAGLMVSQFAKWVRGIHTFPRDVSCNLLSMEMSLYDEPAPAVVGVTA